VASVLFEPWEADALRALLSLWCGAAVPELDADPDDDKLDVPDEPAGPDVVLGEEDPTAGLVEEPDELDDAPDPEPVAGAGYLTGVTPLPDPDCPVGGRFVCFWGCTVRGGGRFEARCTGPGSSGGIEGVRAMPECRSRALGTVRAVVCEPAEPPGDESKTLAPISAATRATAMRPAAKINRP